MTSAAATTSAGVWVKLYIGDNDPRPTVFKIEPIPKDVNDLRKEIKKEKPNDLKDIDADELDVYPQGTTFPIPSNTDKLNVWDGVPSTTGPNPLIVVARQRQRQQQDDTPPQRERPLIRKSASSTDPSVYSNVWRLGNAHNFPILVRTMLLFSTGGDKLRWTPHSEYLDNASHQQSVYSMAQKAAGEALRRHCSMIRRGSTSDSFGVFRFRPDIPGSGNFDEQRLSIAFTSAFDKFIISTGFQDAIFGAREQYDESKNSQDYVLNRILDGGTLPMVVIEFANDNGKNRDYKEAQIFTYISNNTHLLPADRSMLNIGVSFCYLKTTPVMQVFGYYQVDSQICHVVPMTPRLTVDQENLANLFYATLAFTLSMTLSDLPLKQPDTKDLPFLNGYGGVVKLQISDSKFMCKVMNYEDFHPLRIENGGRGRIPADERRTPEHAKAMLGGKVWSIGDEPDTIHVVSYNFVEGDHNAAHSHCIANCIGHLKSAHQGSSILHCDLHLGNFIFNENDPEKSRIIDWDHARNIEHPGNYVSGWLELPERHPSAKAGSAISMVHERYSLGRVLSRFCPLLECESKQAEWDQVCRQAQDVDCDLAEVERMALEINCKLKFKDQAGRTLVTGSPPRGIPFLESIDETMAGMNLIEGN